ncbi:MAG: phosphate signaling complex protein PhoU [Acidiferrobacterales bacterium]|nr:phosphate signaling complex protein PhoU [Acidiferrobacterales bacterium]
MTIQGEGHIFTRFDEEMKTLHGLVVEMGKLASKQLNDAVTTLRSEDVELAYKVINNDAKLNQLDIDADDLITTIIARRSPVAKDLREIIAVGKIVSELERAGDEARKIAGLTIRFFEGSSRPPNEEILRDIYALSEYVTKMLNRSMESFDQLDLDGAIDVLHMGMKLDDQLQSILRHLSTFIMEDSRNVGNFVDIVLGIRALERFGGHAKNISGHIVFIKNGIDVRHEGVDSILKQLK